jgi:hypothetical protein
VKTTIYIALAIVGGALGCPANLIAQGNQQSASSTSPAQELQSPSVSSQMQTVIDELRQLREENRQLQKRVSDLEQGKGNSQAAAPAAGTGPAVTTPASSSVAQGAPAIPASPPVAQSAPPVPQSAPRERTKILAEIPGAPTVQPFGTFGIRYQGLFNQGTPDGYTNYYNQPEVVGRFGVKGQIGSRVSYLMRFSTGISTIGADPWVSFADPGDRRYVGFDSYNVTFAAVKGERYNQTIIAGKVTNVPAARGTTELIVDEDFGLPLFANLSSYTFNSKTQLSMLTSIGFVTNAGANVVSALDRQLYPVVSGVGGGQISDINQNGPPRANCYLDELAVNYGASPSLKFRGSLGFINVSHANDVPLFEGATGLLGIEGLMLAGMPSGTSTNLPAMLPRDSNGFVSIIAAVPGGAQGSALETALVDYRDASAYRILDTFGSITLHADQARPIRLFGEWSHNIGAGDNIFGPASPGSVKALAQKRADGLVLGIDLGDIDAPRHFLVSYKFVMIQSDAMLDYVNNDQWHTNMRGHDFTFKYAQSKYITPFFTMVVGQNYDSRLVGFSTLATYPARDLLPGEDPWMWRPRAGVLFNF